MDAIRSGLDSSSSVAGRGAGKPHEPQEPQAGRVVQRHSPLPHRATHALYTLYKRPVAIKTRQYAITRRHTRQKKHLPLTVMHTVTCFSGHERLS